MPPLPTDPPSAAATLACPSALEALVWSVKAGARCRDGGAQAAAAALTSLAAAITSSPTLPTHALPHLATLLSLTPVHPHRAVRATTLTSTAALGAALAHHDPYLAASSLLPAVAAGMADPAPEVREAAVKAAGGVVSGSGSSSTRNLLPLLLAGATDTDTGVAAAAVAGLAGSVAPAPPCPAWQAWVTWGACAGVNLPWTRPLAAATTLPCPPCPPPALIPPLLSSTLRLPPRALWGLVCLAGPGGLAKQVDALVVALDAVSGSVDDPALPFAAQAAGAALPPHALVEAAFSEKKGASPTIRTCLLFGMVVAGHELDAHAVRTVTAWLERWWAEEEGGEAAASAAWPVLQAAGLAARLVAPPARAAVAHRLWCLGVRASAAIGPSAGADAAVARLVADLVGGETAPPAWGADAVAGLLAPSPALTTTTIASLEATLLAMATAHNSLPPAALASVLAWVEETQRKPDPPTRAALVRLVGRVAATPGGAAALGGTEEGGLSLADHATTLILLPCLTQPNVGGGGVRAAAAATIELTTRFLTSPPLAASLTSALAARATTDTDPAARAAACGALAGVMGAFAWTATYPLASWEEGMAALEAATDDAGDGAASAGVRGAAVKAMEELSAGPGLRRPVCAWAR